MELDKLINIERYFKFLNILILIVVMSFIALSNKTHIKYWLVSFYLIFIGLFLIYYFFKNRPINKKGIFLFIIFILVVILWIIYILLRAHLYTTSGTCEIFDKI
jgi:hypothetical protein